MPRAGDADGPARSSAAVDPRTAVWSTLAFARRAAVRASSREIN